MSGMATEAMTYYERLSSCLAVKCDYSYSSTMFWLCYCLTFSLLWLATQCIRGARSSCVHAAKSPPPIDLTIFELHKALVPVLVHCLSWHVIQKKKPEKITVHVCSGKRWRTLTENETLVNKLWRWATVDSTSTRERSPS